jgi:hypothetical protein
MQRGACSDPSQRLWLSAGAIVIPPTYPPGVEPIDYLNTTTWDRFIALAADPLPLFVTATGTPLDGSKLGIVENTRHPRRSPWAMLVHMPAADATDPTHLRPLQALLALNHSDGIDLIAGIGDTLIIRRQRYVIRVTPAGIPVLELQSLLRATSQHLTERTTTE